MTTSKIEQAMQIAGEHHEAGRLPEAEAIYRRILDQVPDHSGALHLLGVVAAQTGHLDAAIDLIGRAIDVNPAVAEYHNSLGESYRRSGQCERALACLSHAIELMPDYSDAHNNLGVTLKDLGRLDEAIAAYGRAVDLEPSCAEAQSNLGVALYQTGRPEEAIAAYRRAIEGKPDHADAHINLAIALHGTGQLEEAVAACRRVLELRPDLALAQTSLGHALKEIGRHEEAIAAYRQAIVLRPDHAEAQSDLGAALCEAGRHDEAMAAHRRAIALQFDYAEAYNNLGVVFYDTGRLDEAVAVYRRAIELKPRLAVAHNNLAALFKDQGRIDEALACYRAALDAKPDFATAASNLLFALHFHPDYDAEAILAQHRRWARQYAEPLASSIRPHRNDRSPDRRLRIGFVSPDFRNHPVGQLLSPLFAHRDHRQAEYICYSDVRAADAATRRFRALADQWHDIAGSGDAILADRIRGDEIDILVDLALHTAHNRMGVFARKPAPVQVSMLGMPTTTGLATIDYRLTDPYFDPPGPSDGDYTERSIRLPHCIWCYEPLPEAPPVVDPPMERTGFVTLGCLNQFAKASRPVLQAWISILQALPGARLVLQSPSGTHRGAVQRFFEEGGIAGERIEFVSKVPRPGFLERFHRLDLCLDPFPYNGHTTTLDSLWMGVPVITLAGRTGVGRGGMSILSNVGLPELIAGTAEQYVAIAVELARDRSRLTELRAALRPRMRASPLLDAQGYAADVEAAFRWMWTTWCCR